MIPFNKPALTGNEQHHVLDAMHSGKLSGDGKYTAKCHQWFESRLSCEKALLTPSCTHALEMAAILIDIQPGDEVIMPSYTFVSTANAFVLRGAKVVFVDIRPDTMNIDETFIEDAINSKTKAIVVVHYAGVSCEMDTIMAIADKHDLFVVEDAAQGMMSTYKDRPLGTIGHLGTYSFHETKNYTSGGEGGLLIINDPHFVERAEIIREKGTNRSQFFRGAVDKYSWVDIGSSQLLNDLSAAFLWGQLEEAETINSRRLEIFNQYYSAFHTLEKDGFIELATIPDDCRHNGHMFYLKTSSLEQRSRMISFLAEHYIMATFHYVPLHSSLAGKRFGEFFGNDIHTTQESEKLLRLPMFYNLEDYEIEQIIETTNNFFSRGI